MVEKKAKRGRPPGSQATDDILQGAIAAFAEYGFNNCTVSHILEASGCSRTNFYRFFESKEDVFKQLIFVRLASMEEKLTEGLPAMREGQIFADQLETFLRLYFEYCFGFGDLLPVMFEAHNSHPEHREVCDQIRSHFISLIVQLLESNHKSSPDALLMNALVAGTERILTGLSDEPIPVDEKLERAVELSMAMYLPVLDID